jgi:metal-responsive CopG/Arc/MetJ family transcriptional regulator
LKYGRIASEHVEGERRKAVVVTVRLSQQLVELVDRYRARLGLSRSDVIRIALAEFFSRGGGRDQAGG